MGQAVIAFGIAIVLRVGAIDAVDIGGFQHRLGTELGCPQHGSSVRGEERIAGSPCQQHHPPLLDVAQGAAPFVALADLRHAKRRHGTSCQAGFFHRALERERVHHGGEHSHQVASYTGYTFFGDVHSAKDITAADDDRDLHTKLPRSKEIGRNAFERRLMDAEPVGTHESLAGDLRHNAPVDGFRHLKLSRACGGASGAAR